MGIVVGALRLPLVLLVVLLGAVICGFSGVLSRRRFSRLAMGWHAAIVALLGVQNRYRGAALAEGALVLSNHISWLDILLFGARWPVVFLGNREIARWPVLGWVIARAGTLFIERGKGAQKALTDIGAALKRRHTVVLFPEGRTTDGRAVLRFQPRLIQAAIDAGAPVQPAAVRYFDAAGNRVARHSFAGSATLPRSVWKTVSGPPIIAEITLFAPLPPGDERHALARRAEDAVRSVLESQSRTQSKSANFADISVISAKITQLP